MPRPALRLAPVRVGLERPWAFREGYRKVVRRHNWRAMALIPLLVPLMVGSVIPLQPGTAHLPLSVRKAVAVGLFVLWFAVIAGFLVWRARKDCSRLGLQCPACGKGLYGSKRMGAWLEGDTQSIGFCPHCKQAIQCARPGVALVDPVEGTPLSASVWSRRRWIQAGGMAALLISGILCGWGMLHATRLIRGMASPSMGRRMAPLSALFLCGALCGTWLASIRGLVRISGAFARKAGLTCSRCAEPLTGRRAVQEETPLRLTCLACGTLMRVEA